jgi:murein DD-endopeptidase MepM/ murein hydrolase activator NlpD
MPSHSPRRQRAATLARPLFRSILPILTIAAQAYAPVAAHAQAPRLSLRTALADVHREVAAAGEHRASALLIPVEGVPARNLRDSYYEARSEGRVHDAIDIHAPQGTPVLAAADGTILRFHQGSKGGNAIYQMAEDGRTRFYYAHLQRYAEGLKAGDRVQRGDVIGYVGDTGNAAPGDYHLHFSIAILSDLHRWWEGRNLDPYPILRGDEQLPQQ